MNSKERVLNSLKYIKTDRIAKFDSYWPEFVIKTKNQLSIDNDIDLNDYFDVDMAVIATDESPYPDKYEFLSENSMTGETIYRNKYGMVVRTKAGCFFEEELEPLIKSYKDLERYPFDDPFSDKRYESYLKSFKTETSKGRCVFGKVGGPYIRSSFIRGQTDYLLDIASDEGFALELAQRVGDFLICIGKELIRRSDLYDTGIIIYDDMAFNQGMMMSPESFYKIFYPVYKKIVAELKSTGISMVGLHSDGNIEAVLDMLIECGINFINPIEPKAGMSIEKLKKKYGRKLAYVGGMCNSDVLINGPELRIIDKTIELIEAAKDGGVIAGAHSIGPDIPVENYLLYINQLKIHGNFIV